MTAAEPFVVGEGLRVWPELEQRSPEWYAARRGIVTASSVGTLLTPTGKVANNPQSRALTLSLVAERITDYTEPSFVSYDMQRGINEEPIARYEYSQARGVDVAECGFMVNDRWGFSIGCSPDGLVGDDGMIEIKSRRQKKQVETVLDDTGVPAEVMAQLQAALLVSGRHWIDYVSFSGGMHLWVKRVLPDPKWHEAILEAVSLFEDVAGQMVATYTKRVDGLPMTERVPDPFAEITV